MSSSFDEVSKGASSRNSTRRRRRRYPPPAPALLLPLFAAALGSSNANNTTTSSANPYQRGCLYAKNLTTQIRVCRSDDPPSEILEGLCRPPPFEPYAEIRLQPGDWASTFFGTWILQILLSEILQVPTSLEMGDPVSSVSLYHPDSPLDHHSNYSAHLSSMEMAYQHNGDCSKANEDADQYQQCAHFVPEAWNGEAEAVRELVYTGVMEPPQALNMLSQQGWYIPKFTAQRDPSLLSYLGLQGKENRKKLAERFKRPLTWQQYCEQISTTNCTTPDEHAQRPPSSTMEPNQLFVEDLYKGYFHATEKEQLYPSSRYLHRILCAVSLSMAKSCTDSTALFEYQFRSRCGGRWQYLSSNGRNLEGGSRQPSRCHCFLVVAGIVNGTNEWHRRRVYAGQSSTSHTSLCGKSTLDRPTLCGRSCRSTNGSCVAAIWLINIGYTMELAPLVVKVAAVNHITRTGLLMKRAKIKRSLLFGVVCMIGVVVVLFLTLWTVLDQPKLQHEYELTESQNENGETIVHVLDICGSESDKWTYIAVGWIGFLLLCTTILAIQMRKVQMASFNETSTLALLVYSHMVFVLLRVVTYLLSSKDISQYTLARCQSLIFSFDTAATIAIYFVPKFTASTQQQGLNISNSSFYFGVNTSFHSGLNTMASNSRLQTTQPKQIKREPVNTCSTGPAEADVAPQIVDNAENSPTTEGDAKGEKETNGVTSQKSKKRFRSSTKGVRSSRRKSWIDLAVLDVDGFDDDSDGGSFNSSPSQNNSSKPEMVVVNANSNGDKEAEPLLELQVKELKKENAQQREEISELKKKLLQFMFNSDKSLGQED